jgi:hypothetical protein
MHYTTTLLGTMAISATVSNVVISTIKEPCPCGWSLLFFQHWGKMFRFVSWWRVSDATRGQFTSAGDLLRRV